MKKSFSCQFFFFICFSFHLTNCALYFLLIYLWFCVYCVFLLIFFFWLSSIICNDNVIIIVTKWRWTGKKIAGNINIFASVIINWLKVQFSITLRSSVFLHQIFDFNWVIKIQYVICMLNKVNEFFLSPIVLVCDFNTTNVKFSSFFPVCYSSTKKKWKLIDKI